MKLEHQIAELAGQVAEGNTDSGGVLADLLQDHDHPLAPYIRRLHDNKYKNEWEQSLDDHYPVYFDRRDRPLYADLTLHSPDRKKWFEVAYLPYSGGPHRLSFHFGNFEHGASNQLSVDLPADHHEADTLARQLHAYHNTYESGRFAEHVNEIKAQLPSNYPSELEHGYGNEQQ